MHQIIEKKVQDIMQTVRALANGNRIFYSLSVFSPSISSKPIELYRGTNATSESKFMPKEQCYGDRMVEQLESDIRSAVENTSNVRIDLKIKDGKRADVADFQIVLREEYSDNTYTQPAPQPQIIAPQPAPQQQQRQETIQGLGSLNELINTAFGGLGGVESQGLGAIMGVRDQLLRTEFEQRDTQRAHDYERRDLQRKIDEANAANERLQKQLDEQAAQLKALAELTEQNRSLKEQVAEYERKNSPSIAGIALSGVAARAADMLFMKHAGTIGRLFGVDKDTMLGMLAGDEEEEEQPQPQQQYYQQPAAEQPTVTVEGADDEGEGTTEVYEEQ